jgi:hypothetical protein
MAQFVLFMSQDSFFNFLKKYEFSILPLAGRASNLPFGFSLPSRERFLTDTLFYIKIQKK